MEAWITWWSQQRGNQPVYHADTSKGHGRSELRDVWTVPCDPEQHYLHTQYGWPGVQWCGRIRRSRKTATSQEERVRVRVAGVAFPWSLTTADAARLLRNHWTIKNRVFYVRDVTMDEDRLHGCRIAPALSSIRNAARSLVRHLFSGHFLPDAQRLIRARLDIGFSLLLPLRL